MRPRTHRPLMALFMVIPLSAVPLLAVFGIPEFAPATADSGAQADDPFDVMLNDAVPFSSAVQPARREDPFARPVPAVQPAGWHYESPPSGESLDVAFASSDAPRNEPPQDVRRTGFDQTSAAPPAAWMEYDDRPADRIPVPRRVAPNEALNGWDSEPLQPSFSQIVAANQNMPIRGQSPPAFDRETPAAIQRTSETATAYERTPGTFTAAVEGRTDLRPTSEPLTWRAATARLNELGIRQFRLQPGRHEHEFLFSCSFTPADNPRITHRFEAEATEPLRAVQKVLEQIELWQQTR